jgi:hypothetical protein
MFIDGNEALTHLCLILQGEAANYNLNIQENESLGLWVVGE